MKVCARLGVHGDDVRTRIGKRLNIFLGLDNHQMDIHDLLGCRANRSYDQWANRDVGHETAVHDVDVDPIRASAVDRLDFSLKPAKISGKDRGGNSQRLG
jgi:hypothetical protein